jgi:SEC-C motif
MYTPRFSPRPSKKCWCGSGRKAKNCHGIQTAELKSKQKPVAKSQLVPPPKMKLWLPWSELNGSSPLTIEEFRAALREYPRGAILIACARFSIIFKFGPEANTVASQAISEYWVPRLIRPDLVDRAMQAVESGRPIFFQGQLRFLASEAMRLDPAPPENGAQVPDWVLGSLLLGAGELLYKKHVANLKDPLDVMANLVADFLPVFEIDSITDPLLLFLRLHIYLTVIIPRLPAHLRVFDVPAEFEKVFGFPLKLYSQFVYAFTVHAMNGRTQIKLGDVPEAGLPISWFKKTILTDDQISDMFDTVCCRLSDLPDKKVVHGYADFEFLKDHPYLRVDDKVYDIDYEYAVAKLESGALWRVAMSMPIDRRLNYFGFWGDVFEEYVNWIFGSYADKNKNAHYPSPRYLNHKESRAICDMIVMCGSTAVLIEAKAATCAASVRYSGDHKLVREYMDKRFVEGTDRPVGVSQLLTAIDKIGTMPKDNLPEWLRGIKKIIPLIITKDDIGSSWMTNAYLNARFEEKLNRLKYGKFEITPLVSMNVASLERAVAAMREMAFSDIVEDRIHQDPKLGRPFEAASSWVPRGTPRKIDRHLEVMKELAAEMQADLGMVEE